MRLFLIPLLCWTLSMALQGPQSVVLGECFRACSNPFTKLNELLISITDSSELVDNARALNVWLQSRGGTVRDQPLMELVNLIIPLANFNNQTLCQSAEIGRTAIKLGRLLNKHYWRPKRGAHSRRRANRLVIDFLEGRIRRCFDRWAALWLRDERRFVAREENFRTLLRFSAWKTILKPYTGSDPTLGNLSYALFHAGRGLTNVLAKLDLYQALRSLHMTRSNERRLEEPDERSGKYKLRLTKISQLLTSYFVQPCHELVNDEQTRASLGLATQALSATEVTDDLFPTYDDRQGQLLRWATHYATCWRLLRMNLEQLVKVVSRGRAVM